VIRPTRPEAGGRPLLVIALAVGALAAAIRLLTTAGFSNDHFFYLSRATQVLSGAWPVRDFIDPGFPLAWALSAAAQLVGGRTLLSEAVLVALAFGAGAGLTAWIAARGTGSITLALWAAGVQVAIFPRAYSYPKVLIYAVAAAMFAAYAVAPSSRLIVRLAGVTAIAFLFRHDHGLYLAVASCVLLAGVGGRHAAAGNGLDARPLAAPAVRRVALFGALAGAFVAPYIAYVQWAGGVGPYFAAGRHFSEREAGRTLLLFPGVDRLVWSADVLSVGAYYVFWAAPVAAVAVAWTSPRATAAARWTVTALAVVAALMNSGFLRDPLAARVPDAIVPPALLIAWVAAQAWSAWPHRPAGRWVIRGITALLLAVFAAGAGTIGNFAELLRRAELARWPPRPVLRWREVTAQLREPYAERQMPTDLAFALVPFYRYVQACAPPNARILVTGFAPEIAFYAARGFAGGHPSLYRGYFSAPADQRAIVARLDRELVLFVVASPEGVGDFADSFPIVNSYVTDRFVTLADVPVDGFDVPARLQISRAFASSRRDETTGWPCPGASR